MMDLLGQGDDLLRLIEDQFESDISVRGNQITINGLPGESQALSSLFTEMIELVERGEDLNRDNLERSIDMLKHGECSPTDAPRRCRPVVQGQGDPAQDRRPEALRGRDSREHGDVRHRAGRHGQDVPRHGHGGRGVHAPRRWAHHPDAAGGRGRGELGYLPGTLFEKVDPYLRPLYDALFDMMDIEKAQQLMDRGVIEVAPLAFMRGRTLNDSFIILDEAQNTSPEQMKMFLTRLGFGSKVVITGDVTQIDLPKGASGLKQVRDILDGTEDVAFMELGARDVVRHKLVQRIVSAYHVYEEAKARQTDG